MMLIEQWALLWSHRQNCMHIEPLARMLMTNACKFRDDRPGDYVLMAVGERAHVDAMATAMRPRIKERDDMRAMDLARVAA